MRRIPIFLIFYLFFFAIANNLVAQQGSASSGGDATGWGGEFSYTIGQADYNWFFSSLGSAQLGLQHTWLAEEEVIHCALDVRDFTVYSYEDLCFNSAGTVTMAGDGEQFIVEAGGHANIIAGENIILKDGTTIKPGGNLHAWITTDGSYCNDSISKLLSCILETPDTTVESNENLCFNAIETVTIAGDGKQFIVEPGGHADIISGHNIIFREGTIIKPGGSLHAWITTDGSYCSDTTSGTLPNVIELPDITVLSDDALCFDATETVIVAGHGKQFIVEPSGHADIIAGKNILFREGTIIKSGGSLRAWITTDGSYCENTTSMLAVTDEEALLENLPDDTSEEAELPLFKVYPNPTNGDFTLELTEYNEFGIITVEIYTIQGQLIIGTQLPEGKVFNFSFAERKAGVYLIRVLKDKNVSTGKIIKQ